MNIDTFEEFSAIRRRLKRLERKQDDIRFDLHDIKNMMRQVMGALNLSVHMEIAQMQELEELRTRVAEARGTMESSKVLIAGLRQQLQDAGHLNAAETKAELKRIADELNAMEDDLAAAVVANPNPNEVPGSTGSSTGGDVPGATGGSRGGGPTE